MGFLAPKDLSTNPAPVEVYNWRIYFLAISAAMGSSMFGYDSAFIGGTLSLSSFQARFGLATAQGTALASLRSNIVSTFQAGCFFGVLLCYPTVERLGMKWTLVLCGLVFNIGAIVQTVATGQLGMIYAGRALTGLGVGSSSLVIPAYISESSPPGIRGRLIGIFEILLQISQLPGFWVNYGVNLHISKASDTQWRIPFGIQLVPGVLLMVLMSLQTESPRFLAKKGKWSEVQKVLSHIRNLPEGHEYIAWEMETIRNQLESESSGVGTSTVMKLKEVFRTNVKKRLGIGMALMMFQNLSGVCLPGALL